MNYNENYFNVNNQGYGMNKCIIFRANPNEIVIESGKTFTVEVEKAIPSTNFNQAKTVKWNDNLKLKDIPRPILKDWHNLQLQRLLVMLQVFHF